MFNTVFGGDDSATDFPHITDLTDFGTSMKVNNLGDQGTQIIEALNSLSSLVTLPTVPSSARAPVSSPEPTITVYSGGNCGKHNS